MNTIKATSISFKANYFSLIKKGKYYSLNKISTDNEEQLGNEPVLQTRIGTQDIELPMLYNGKYYTTNFNNGEIINKYRIYYKDTGLYENKGKEQIINSLFFEKKAVKADREYNNLSMEQALSKGKTCGKVFVNTLSIPHDEFAILILDEIPDAQTLISDIPQNVRGVITASCPFGVLSHCANLTRNKFSSMSVIWDEDKFNDLKNQEGKYILLDNSDAIVKYKKIKPTDIFIENKKTKEIKIPKLDNVEKLLMFDELSTKNSGNKGYRLGIMKKLVDRGNLKNITIPKGFVIPEGYINNLNKYINVNDEIEKENLLYDGKFTQDVEKQVKNMNMNRSRLIIRSNMNTEDLDCFSSAGIYDSYYIENDYILPVALDVINSKNSKIAKKIHDRYGIKDNTIQPSVIVQEWIPSDYSFTLYSNDGDGNIIIELSDSSSEDFNSYSSLIKYNKKTKELKLEKSPSQFAEYLLDETGNIINQQHEQNNIDKNWQDLKEPLNIIVNGALVLEEFFKHPQDIEGGIGQDGKIYFWQTRDIVANASEKI
ncbi:MAG: PEP/pyruvate-binding domain-containing protein [Candidatus Gastranaerophilaceae bacterium]